MLRNKDYEKIEERIEKKLNIWKGKYLSVGGRLVLMNYPCLCFLSLRFQKESLRK
jgi:hypothetical protein